MLRCLLPQVTQVWAKKQSAPDYTDQRFSRPFPLVGSFFTPIRAADMSLFRHYMTLKLRSGQGKTHTDQTKSENKVQSFIETNPEKRLDFMFSYPTQI